MNEIHYRDTCTELFIKNLFEYDRASSWNIMEEIVLMCIYHTLSSLPCRLLCVIYRRHLRVNGWNLLPANNPYVIWANLLEIGSEVTSFRVICKLARVFPTNSMRICPIFQLGVGYIRLLRCLANILASGHCFGILSYDNSPDTSIVLQYPNGIVLTREYCKTKKTHINLLILLVYDRCFQNKCSLVVAGHIDVKT